MHTVITRAHRSAHTTARDLRVLMRDQQVTSSTLAWILRCSWLRAARLRYVSKAWTVDEVLALVEACAPTSRSVPAWGEFAGAGR